MCATMSSCQVHSYLHTSLNQEECGLLTLEFQDVSRFQAQVECYASTAMPRPLDSTGIFQEDHPAAAEWSSAILTLCQGLHLRVAQGKAHGLAGRRLFLAWREPILTFATRN